MEIISRRLIREKFFDFLSKVPSSGIETINQMRKRIFFADNSYSPVPGDLIVDTFKSSALDFPKTEGNETDLNDCDDYALQMKASVSAHYRTLYYSPETEEIIHPPAIGMLITRVHALNICYGQIDNKMQVYIADASVQDGFVTAEPNEAGLRMTAGNTVIQPTVNFIYM